MRRYSIGELFGAVNYLWRRFSDARTSISVPLSLACRSDRQVEAELCEVAPLHFAAVGQPDADGHLISPNAVEGELREHGFGEPHLAPAVEPLEQLFQ